MHAEKIRHQATGVIVLAADEMVLEADGAAGSALVETDDFPSAAATINGVKRDDVAELPESMNEDAPDIGKEVRKVSGYLQHGDLQS